MPLASPPVEPTFDTFSLRLDSTRGGRLLQYLSDTGYKNLTDPRKKKAALDHVLSVAIDRLLDDPDYRSLVEQKTKGKTNGTGRRRESEAEDPRETTGAGA